MNFLMAERNWIIDKLFAGRNVADIAHGLVGKRTCLLSTPVLPISTVLSGVDVKKNVFFYVFYSGHVF